MNKNIKQWFFKLKYVIALAILESSLLKRIEQRQEISRLREEIDTYNRKFEEDKKVLNALKHDPEAVRDVARSRYYMKTDNEDIFIVEDDQ